MKPTLGIFGDSWAVPSAVFDSNYRNILSSEVLDTILNKKLITENRCWSKCSILTDHYEITNHGLAGSSIGYSYEEFKSNHHKYDKIIFIVTGSNRLKINYKKHKIHISNYGDLDYNIKFKIPDNSNINDSDKEQMIKIMGSLKDCWVYIMDDNIYQAATLKLVEIVKSLRPEAVIMPAFDNIFADYSPLRKEFRGLKLFYLSQFEEQSVNLNNLEGRVDLRNAHMTNENNLIFAEYMRLRLLGNDPKISYRDFLPAKLDERDFYFPLQSQLSM